MELSEQIAGMETRQDSISRQFTHSEDTITHLQFYNENITTFYSGTRIETSTTGSSFILNNASYGVLGTTSPQPYLGDSSTPYVVVTDQFVGSPFLNSGLIQIRDMILGSSNAVSPTLLSIGSGIFVWHGSLTALSGFAFNVTATRAGAGVQYGSFFGTTSTTGSYRELAISGGALFIYDTFPLLTLNAGSTARFTATFRIGS